jgi:MerR family Zn(II)-responsive transcriptional regulator of zntA
MLFFIYQKEGAPKMGFTVKQISGMTGLSADTLRYYDKEGIVSPERHENGYRYYDEADVMVLKYLVVLKYAQFSLAEIKAMVGLFGNEPSAECNEISRGLLNNKIAELKQTVRNYQKIIKLMEESLPMVDCIESFIANEARIVEFIYQIFDDIRNDILFKED